MDLKIFAKTVEKEVYDQLDRLMSIDVFKDAKIRIMPDTHSGKGCVIGFTANLGDKVVPNLVGVDVGCGMYVLKLGKLDISKESLSMLDSFIHAHIPSGFSVNDSKHSVEFKRLKEMRMYSQLKSVERVHSAIGTLGSGNHFIELDIDTHGDVYLVIHTGSRNLGQQLAKHYQNLAVEHCKDLGIPKDLCYIEGDQRDDYLHDMKICQDYAKQNREEIAKRILSFLGVHVQESFHTVHNYIDFEDNIVRKGAIRCNNGEKCIIPLNMRDGAIVAVGKGNEDWNCSAPHGAGRMMSRKASREAIQIDDFKSVMKGIFTTSVNENTIDESPMAYKDAKEIIDLVQDTADIVEVIKPIYNFKDSSKH